MQSPPTKRLQSPATRSTPQLRTVSRIFAYLRHLSFWSLVRSRLCEHQRSRVGCAASEGRRRWRAGLQELRKGGQLNNVSDGDYALIRYPLTPIESPIEQFQDSQRIPKISKCCTGVCSFERSLSCADFYQLRKVQWCKRLCSVSSKLYSALSCPYRLCNRCVTYNDVDASRMTSLLTSETRPR